ncbi:MAG: hypothetical protein OXF46_01360 [Rhodobacteraceae bacterium]|nr:hypothetical protein [Paracoccaceae bacterium]
MNIVNPFREGNGSVNRIRLDLIRKRELKRADKDEYLSSMHRSVVKEEETEP